MRRIGWGLMSILISFASALGAIECAGHERNWQSPSFLVLVEVLIFMLFFVLMQVAGMLALASLAVKSETDDPTKRP